jgi:hypothetical protein
MQRRTKIKTNDTRTNQDGNCKRKSNREAFRKGNLMPQSTLTNRTNDGLLALFKGDSGTGKSVAALSYPKPYVFDFDRKMPGIARKHFPHKEIHYDTFEDIFEVSDKLVDLMRDCPYETLITDSFTALTNLTIESVGKVKGESVPEMLQRVQDTKNKNRQLEMMPIDYYGGEDRFCNFFISQLKRLQARAGNPKYVIVIAHVLTVDSAPDLKTKIVTRTRSIVSKGRKVAAWLPTEFDDMYIFGYEQGNAFAERGSADSKPKRVCITESYGEDAAKCSIRGLPSTLDFTDGSLYDCMFNRVVLG